MFCQKCGAKNSEDVNFCINCGTSLTAPEFQQPVAPPPPPPPPPPPVSPQQQYTPPQFSQAQYTQPVYTPPTPPKKKKTGLVAVIGILFVLIIAVVLIFIFTGGSGGSNAEDTAKGYLEAVFDFDYSKAEKYSFIDIEKYFEIEEEKDASNLDEEFKNAKEDSYQELEEQYGDNAKITVSVTGSEVLSGEDLDSAISSYIVEEDYFKGEIKSVMMVTVLLVVKGDTDEDTETMEMYVVKSGSKWYVLNGLDFITEFLTL